MLISYTIQLMAIVCLSLAMNKHFKGCFSQPITTIGERIFTWLGWSGVLISLVIATQLLPSSIILVYWSLWLGTNILLVSLSLALFKR